MGSSQGASVLSFLPFCLSHQGFEDLHPWAPKQQPCVLWSLQSQRHFFFCTVRRLLPLHSLCFHRDFKNILFMFQWLLDFFSKQLSGRETKLKGKHYALLKPQATAPWLRLCDGAKHFCPLLSLRTANFAEGSASLCTLAWEGQACPGLPHSSGPLLRMCTACTS